jgi:hypothetical protein
MDHDAEFAKVKSFIGQNLVNKNSIPNFTNGRTYTLSLYNCILNKDEVTV